MRCSVQSGLLSDEMSDHEVIVDMPKKRAQVELLRDSEGVITEECPISNARDPRFGDEALEGCRG
jgi:hypothetical protein